MAGVEQRDDRGGGDNRRRDGRRSEDRRDEEQRDDDRRRYRAPTCYNCHEPGHYANQCPERNRRRYYVDKPSTSNDSRGGRSPRTRDYRRREDSPPPGNEKMLSTVAELGKSVAAMKDFYGEARKKKEDKSRRKLEMKEAEEREKAEQEKAERKAGKKLEKARREAQLEAQRRAEVPKDNDIHLAIRLSEMEENFSSKMKCVIEPLKELIKKGKKKVTYASGSNSAADKASDTSVTQELSERTGRLCISEKRKQGPEQVVENSPPMELPPKRTPKRGALWPTTLAGRLTRSKKTVKSPGSAKRKTPVKTPLAAILKTPTKTATPMTIGALQRLRYRDGVMKDLKNLDATELQRICKEEGVPYDGKIDAIFAIADRHVCDRFGPDRLDVTEVIKVNESEVGEPPHELVDN
ncbi:hypothetical protein CBR_g24391 [Chara braunii]|uniref:CCHC-type domain-containing protein n=1 Tax=Chara braunii TaxID=69332 RepID=A0A388JMQ8_CHABU|nr:hypothetical protein CBR_g24391 [Chara braunii]|eukprot:GBG59045.1 hypothetical protein CBR_g24391 [Chara braunii]